MWVACNRARFPATRPCVFCELKIMKIVILIYQIIQKKFAYSELFMLVMIAYIFMFKMVNKMQNSGLEMVAGLTCPLSKNEMWCAVDNHNERCHTSYQMFMKLPQISRIHKNHNSLTLIYPAHFEDVPCQSGVNHIF